MIKRTQTNWFTTATLAIFTFALFLPVNLVAADLEVVDKTLQLSELGVHPETVTFLGDGSSVLLISNRGGKIVHMDIASAEKINELIFDEELELANFSDIVIGLDSKFAYLVGTWSEREMGLLVRLNIETFELQEILFLERFQSPSIAISAYGEVFIGDLVSSTITVLEEYRFEKPADRAISRSEFGRNIYLKYGPAIDLGVSADGRFIAVSHAQHTMLSLIDTQVAEVVDIFGPGEKFRYPFAMITKNYQGRNYQAKNDDYSEMIVAVAEIEEDGLVAARVDRKFQAFREVHSAKLQMATDIEDDGVSSPLSISTDDHLEVVVVSSRNDTRAFFRGPVQSRVVDLLAIPDDIDVSPDGRTVTILDSDKATLRVIRNPLAWAFGSDVQPPAPDSIRETQQLLSNLRYPIGEVDGIYGPNTKRMVGLFQESAGLEAHGRVDDDTLKKIRDVADEIPAAEPEAGANQPDHVPAGSQCAPVEINLRCEVKPVSRNTAQLDSTASFKKSEATGINPVRSMRQIDPRAAPKQFAIENEKVICPTRQDDSLEIQIDAYSFNGRSMAYNCSTYHSCAFIRFRELFAYYSYCSKPQPIRQED